ncbi:hypothetical protein PYCC9005_002694 [Savitreella phatthalungensis]
MLSVIISLLQTTAAQGRCDVNYPVGWRDNMTLTLSDGESRTFGLFIPTTYNDDASKSFPLILDFHGRGGSSAGQFNNSRFFANKAGSAYMVAYPQGCNAAWQGASYANRSCNDTLFATELVDHLAYVYCVDRSRVYASGKSNGGGFVDVLGCSGGEVSGRFAALAMGAPALYADNAVTACNNTSPIPILQVHGRNDTTISFTGGDGLGGTSPDILTWTHWWAVRDGCKNDTAPTVTHGAANVTNTTYTCSNRTVTQLAIDGMGHCWPADAINTDYEKQGAAVCPLGVLDFTQVAVDFFAKWRLN